MKNQKHNNYTTVGLIITYITVLLKFAILYFILAIDYFEHYPIFFIFHESLVIPYMFISLVFLMFTVAFDAHKIKSFFAIGLINILFFSFLGGIFILLGGSIKNTPQPAINNFNSLEKKLKYIEELYEKGILSKEEYDAKRKNIIEKY